MLQEQSTLKLLLLIAVDVVNPAAHRPELLAAVLLLLVLLLLVLVLLLVQVPCRPMGAAAVQLYCC
jgi:hypothetical protein